MTKADKLAADRILRAACTETVRRIRAGRDDYRDLLTHATEAAGLLVDRAEGSS